MRQPAIFLSHGAPTFMLEENATTRFWQHLPAALPEAPRAVLCISAHWDESRTSISGTQGKTGIQHDFYGFSKQLYDIRWNEHEDKATASWLLERLHQLDVKVIEVNRPLDHGVWVPLKTLWPEPEFPVYQLSLSLSQGLDSHWALGQKLSALRDEGVLIIGSGSATHNLSEFRNHGYDSPPPDWVSTFDDWLAETIAAGRTADLLDYRRLAPHAVRNHPTEEHLLPLFAAYGAGTPGVASQRIHSGYTYGLIGMDAWRFD